MFPWACVGDEMDDVRSHPTFARSLASPTQVFHRVMSYFRWAHVGIISSSEDVWVETATKVRIFVFLFYHISAKHPCS